MPSIPRYFSGFSLQNEQEIFKSYIPKDTLCVVGFSLGAIDALEYTLNSTYRIDRLVLISPAFFNDKSTSFKRAQLRYFATRPMEYMDQFYQNLYTQTNTVEAYHKAKGNKNDLERLLGYTWQVDKIEALIARGVVVEIFIGEDDKIVDSKKSLEFFTNSGAIVYHIKQAGHILS